MPVFKRAMRNCTLSGFSGEGSLPSDQESDENLQKKHLLWQPSEVRGLVIPVFRANENFATKDKKLSTCVNILTERSSKSVL